VTAGRSRTLPLRKYFSVGDVRARAVDDLVRAGGQMGGDTGHQIGGQRDDPAAAGDGVHKAREKHERQDDEQVTGVSSIKTTSFCKYRQNHSTGAKKMLLFFTSLW